MTAGIHVQLELRGVDGCPASTLSEEVPVESVTVDTQGTGETTRVLGEVTVDRTDVTDGTVDRTEGAEADGQALDEIFADGSRSIYRYTHEAECPCSRVPTHGCPVRDRRADGGRLHLSFVAPDLDTLRAVTSDLRACCTTLTVRRLTRSDAGDHDRSLLVADRSAFTTRQYEVLETAHDMGYFESPKAANSGAVADELGVSVATFIEHLSVAQTKLLDQILSN